MRGLSETEQAVSDSRRGASHRRDDGDPSSYSDESQPVPSTGSTDHHPSEQPLVTATRLGSRQNLSTRRKSKIEKGSAPGDQSSKGPPSIQIRSDIQAPAAQLLESAPPRGRPSDIQEEAAQLPESARSHRRQSDIQEEAAQSPMSPRSRSAQSDIQVQSDSEALATQSPGSARSRSGQPDMDAPATQSPGSARSRSAQSDIQVQSDIEVHAAQPPRSGQSPQNTRSPAVQPSIEVHYTQPLESFTDNAQLYILQPGVQVRSGPSLAGRRYPVRDSKRRQPTLSTSILEQPRPLGHDSTPEKVPSDRKSEDPSNSNSRRNSNSPSPSDSKNGRAARLAPDSTLNFVYRVWDAERLPFSQLLASPIFRCLIWIMSWMLRLSTVLMLCYIMIYLLWIFAVAVLSSTPIIGPFLGAIMLFVRKAALNKLEPPPTVYETTTAWIASFGKFISWPYSSASDANGTSLDTFTIPVSFDGINNTISATRRLSDLGLHMLPILTLLEYSAVSLISASDIVSSSNIYENEHLGKGYSALYENTSMLARELSVYDAMTHNLIEEMSWNLNRTLTRIENFTSSLNSTPWSTHIFSLSAASSTACLIAALSGNLMFPGTAFCATSVIAAAQSNCLTYPLSEDHPWCASILVLYPTTLFGANSAMLANKAEGIATEFYDLFKTLNDNIMEIQPLADAARERSGIILQYYSKVNRIRLRNENQVSAEINTMRIKAAETPSWGQWLKGQQSAGLPLQDKFQLESLQRQERHLTQLTRAHSDAHTTLTVVVQTIAELKSLHDTMKERVGKTLEMSNKGVRVWDILAHEIERMKPLVEELDKLGSYVKGRSTQLREARTARFLGCVGLVKEKKSGERRDPNYWEDCFFKNQ